MGRNRVPSNTVPAIQDAWITQRTYEMNGLGTQNLIRERQADQSPPVIRFSRTSLLSGYRVLKQI